VLSQVLPHLMCGLRARASFRAVKVFHPDLVGAVRADEGDTLSAIPSNSIHTLTLQGKSATSW
jgi:hypothetical protein